MAEVSSQQPVSMMLLAPASSGSPPEARAGGSPSFCAQESLRALSPSMGSTSEAPWKPLSSQETVAPTLWSLLVLVWFGCLLKTGNSRSSLGGAGFWGGLSCWFSDGSLLTVSSRGARKQVWSVSLVSFLIRTLILLDQGPILMTPFSLHYLLKALSLNTITFGLLLQYIN